MLDLPVELRRACINALKEDGQALKALRLTCKDVETLATEVLFQKAILNHTDESAEKLAKLKESSLNPLVHNVVINTSDDPEHYGGGDTSEADIRESFSETIANINGFRNLEEIELKFACEVGTDYKAKKGVAETNDFRVEVWAFLLTSLRQAEKVKVLTIKNLQDHHDERTFEHTHFISARSRLSRLHLQIATEIQDACLEDSINLAALRECFTQSLPNIWLKPLTNQLTHLTLYTGECLWGIWPFVDFRKIPPFSRLKSLSLGNLTVAHEWQIDWIVAHSETLEKLLMDDCSIVTMLSMDNKQVKVNFPNQPPVPGPKNRRTGSHQYLVHVAMRWDDIFDRFRISLPHLNHFAMGHGNWRDGQAFEGRYDLVNRLFTERYCVFDTGIGPTQWIMYDERHKNGYTFRPEQSEPVRWPECGDEDREALVKLLRDVEGRAGTKL